MKKYIFFLFAVLILSFLITPNASLAQSTSPTDTDPNPPAGCVSIQNNLRYRDRDSAKSGEVSTLQDFLQSKGYLNSEPTGYMGLLTFQAVKDYQKSKGISPTGYVGPSTRAVIAGDCGGTNPDPVLPPSSDGCLPGYKYSSTTGKPCDDTIFTTSSIYQADGFSFQYDSSATVEKKIGELGIYYGVYKTGGVFESIQLVNSKVVLYDCNKLNSLIMNDKKFLYCKSQAEPATRYWYEKGDKTLIIDVQSSSNKSYSYIIPESVEINSSTSITTPVISGVSGPQSLNVGQQGTWTVNASNPNGGILSYSVDWGDTPIPPCSSSGATCSTAAQVQIQQSATFNHTYTTAGTYVPVFTVTNSSGQSAKTSLSVNVGNAVTPSIHIYGYGGNQKSDSSLSVNIGDTFTISGTPQNIQGLSYWSGTGNPPSGYYNRAYFFDHIFDGSCGKSDSAGDTLWYLTCTTKTAGSSAFYVEIYANGQTYRSNKVVVTVSLSTVPTGKSPIISSVSGPQSLNVNQTGTWTVNASDPNAVAGGANNLTYSVDWGDAKTIYCSAGGVACATATTTPQQSATFTHTYSTAGTYYSTFTVTNSSGQSAQASLSVNITKEAIPIPTAVLSNPVLNTSTSTRSQNVPVGPNGANDIVRATYDLSAGSSDVTITEIKYTALGSTPNPISSIRIGSISAPVVCYMGATCSAYLTGLNIVVPANSTKSIDAYISYGAVGINGLSSGATAQIKMTYVKYAYNGISTSMNTNSEPSPLMTLVSADPTPVNTSPVLGVFVVPTGINAGQAVNFNFSATDANNDNLSWTVDWGELPYLSGTCSITNSQQKQNWTWSGNHTWNTAGTYNAKVTVSDCKGGEASKSFYVTVTNPQPYVQVLYPKGGESIQAGNTVRVQWRATGITSNANSISVQVFKANATNNYYGVSPAFGVTWYNTVEGSVISDTGFYDWAIPSTFSAGQYVVMAGGGPYGLKAYGEPFSIINSSVPGGGIGGGTRIPVAGVSLSSNALNALGEATSVKPQTQTQANVSSDCTVFTKILAKGMDDPEVKCLQKMLGEKGFKVEGVESGKETSYFGYATLMALKKFQTANGLRADGIFGPASSTALLK